MQEEDFCCSVCLDVFIEPTVIQCGHSFCKICIEETLNTTEKCPICRSTAGRITPNRVLENLTIKWMQKTNRGEEYFKRKEQNKRALLVRNRALVLLWTTLSTKTDRKMKLDEILEKLDCLNLRMEIMRQVSIQQNIGIRVEKIDNDVIIQLID